MSISNELNNLLKTKEFKDTHFNFEPEIEYRVSTSSLNLDLSLNGGISQGITRLTGNSESGKSRFCLNLAKNHQDKFGKDSFVFYVRAEGRLNSQYLKASGVNTDPDNWFILRSNTYETVFTLTERLIKQYKNSKKLLFVIDSMNSLVLKADLMKTIEDPFKTMGAAALNSLVMARLGSPVNEYGHMLMLISQVREMPRMGMYDEDKRRDHSKASGGNALIHAPNAHLQFEKRAKRDFFAEEKNKPLEAFANEGIGHTVRITIIKSGNEKSLQKVEYPIKYGVIGRTAVWKELEVYQFLERFKLITKSGAWIKPSDSLNDEITNFNLEQLSQFQGEQKFIEHLDNNKELTNFLFDLIVSRYKKV